MCAINNTNQPPTPQPVTRVGAAAPPQPAPAGAPAPAAGAPGAAPAPDQVHTGPLSHLFHAAEVSLEHLHVPEIAAAVFGGSAAVAAWKFQEEVQSTVRKAVENTHDAVESVKAFQNFKPAAAGAGGTGRLPTGGAQAPKLPPKAGFLREIERPTNAAGKIFTGASVLRGIDGVIHLKGDTQQTVQDFQQGHYAQGVIDALNVASDGLGVGQAAENILKFGGKGIGFLNPLVGPLVNGEAKAIPVVGTLFAGFDLVTRSITEIKGTDAAGKPLSHQARAVDAAYMIGDAAALIAVVTPPPIDIIAGGVAAGATVIGLAIDHAQDIAKYAGKAAAFAGKAVEFEGALVVGGATAVAHGAEAVFHALKFW